MEERVDHAVGQLVDINTELAALEERARLVHNLRPIFLCRHGLKGARGKVQVPGQPNGVGVAGLHAFRGRPADAAGHVVRADNGFARVGAGVFYFHVHSYSANRHHICNL